MRYFESTRSYCVSRSVKIGQLSYLNPSEESEVVQFLTRYAAIGYGKSRNEVIALEISVSHAEMAKAHKKQ